MMLLEPYLYVFYNVALHFEVTSLSYTHLLYDAECYALSFTFSTINSYCTLFVKHRSYRMFTLYEGAGV